MAHPDNTAKESWKSKEVPWKDQTPQACPLACLLEGDITLINAGDALKEEQHHENNIILFYSSCRMSKSFDTSCLYNIISGRNKGYRILS